MWVGGRGIRANIRMSLKPIMRGNALEHQHNGTIELIINTIVLRENPGSIKLLPVSRRTPTFSGTLIFWQPIKKISRMSFRTLSVKESTISKGCNSEMC